MLVRIPRRVKSYNTQFVFPIAHAYVHADVSSHASCSVVYVLILVAVLAKVQNLELLDSKAEMAMRSDKSDANLWESERLEKASAAAKMRNSQGEETKCLRGLELLDATVHSAKRTTDEPCEIYGKHNCFWAYLTPTLHTLWET